MKKLLGIIVLGLLLSGNAHAAKGYKLKIREQNEYGSVLSVNGPKLVDKASKWYKTFKKAEKISTEHCNTMNKNTYAFWGQRSGIFARNSSGNLLSWRSYSSNEEDFASGFIQDYQESNPLTAGYKFRYFCANEEKEAINLYNSYFNFFDYDFSSDNTGSELFISIINKEPYKFINTGTKNYVEDLNKNNPKKKITKYTSMEYFKQMCSDFGFKVETDQFAKCVKDYYDQDQIGKSKSRIDWAKVAEQFDTSPKNKNNKRKCVKQGNSTYVCEDVYEY